jgi:cytochrome c2
MRRNVLVLGLTLLTAFLYGCETEEAEPAEEFKPRWHFLAAGDPEAGKQAFHDLKCTTCHWVSGSVANGPDNGGPELGSMVASASADEIAVSIIAPSHAVSSKGGLWLEETPQEMVDYSRMMTVRQLMDVIAYLRDSRRETHEEQAKE